MRKLNNDQKALVTILIIVSIAIVFQICLSKDLASIIWSCAIVIILFSLLAIYLNKNLEDHNYQKNLIQAAGFGLLAISWFVTGYFTNQQSVSQKKREIRIRMLTDAYFKLQNLNERTNDSPANLYIYAKYSESAINEIQLIGDSKLVELAKKFKDDYTNQLNFDSLVNEIRDELRDELGVAPLLDASSPFRLRVTRKSILPNADTLTSAEEISLIIRLNEDHKELFK